MRLRWSVILPIPGLLLFAAVSYRSMDINRHEQDAPPKFYWWSSLRLDSDPLNKNPVLAKPKPCGNEKQNCASWEVRPFWVEPAFVDRLLVYSALPAFLAGAAIVISLSKLGIDEVLTFMVSMPILLFAWYYFVGWLIERWTYRRLGAKSVPLKID